MSRDENSKNGLSLEVSLDEVEFFKNPQAKIQDEVKIENSKKKVRSFALVKFWKTWHTEILLFSILSIFSLWAGNSYNAGEKKSRELHTSIIRAVSSGHANQVFAVVNKETVYKGEGYFKEDEYLGLALDTAINQKNAKLLSELIDYYKEAGVFEFLDVNRGKRIIDLFSTDKNLPYLKEYWQTFGKYLIANEFLLVSAEKEHQMETLAYAVSQIPDTNIINKHFQQAIKANDIKLTNFYADHGVDFKELHLISDVVNDSIEKNEIGKIKFLVEHGADIHYDRDQAFRTAQRLGHTEIADYIKSVPAQDICPKDYECTKK